MSDSTETGRIVGHIVAEMFDADGNLKARWEDHNQITTVGDQVFADRAAGVGAPAAPTGMRIGTGATAVAKTGAGAAIVTKITGGNVGFDATFPQSAAQGTGRRITWRSTWAAGVGTTASTVSEVVLVNDTIATDTATAAANTLARALPTGLGIKAATDTLQITWTWDLIS